jgi:ParB family chromosome partitioning protein
VGNGNDVRHELIIRSLQKGGNAYKVSTDLFSLIESNVTRQRIEIQHLAPEVLSPNPWNSNKVGPDMERRLRASVEKFGIYKPIICRELSDGSLQILGGEHRWRVACNMGLQSIPVVSVGQIDDVAAKTLGLADNGQYGEDDALKLADILREIGQDDVEVLLPYTETDLAGMFAAASIDLDSLGFDSDVDDELPPATETPRPTATHELMRFKVPIEDRERVQKFIEHIVSSRGLKSEEDSMVAAGMALVEIVNAAKEVM